MRVLGIESSCDETGVALYDTEAGLLAHALHTQMAMHAEYGGVVPELASRDHIRRVIPLTRECLKTAGLTLADLDAIAYTQGPGLGGALLLRFWMQAIRVRPPSSVAQFVFTLTDWLALIAFFACWGGYAWYSERSKRGASGLIRTSQLYRLEWAYRMLERDVRVTDSTLIGNLVTSVSFYANTTIYIIAGLVAALGASDKLISFTADLPFGNTGNRELLEIKLMLVLASFVFAYFKFTWSLRQFNLLSILVGAAPFGQAGEGGDQGGGAADFGYQEIRFHTIPLFGRSGRPSRSRNRHPSQRSEPSSCPRKSERRRCGPMGPAVQDGAKNSV